MSLLDALNQLKALDFDDLDFDNVGDWPLPLKGLACATLFIIVLVLGYWLYLIDLQAQHDRAVATEQTRRDAFRLKTAQAAHLTDYRQQIKTMAGAFENLLSQLPGDTEVPGLLDDMTFIARGAGLQVEHIKLQPEQIHEFHVELPISIRVRGGYHDFGSFVSGVANLPRIVTLHDLSIKTDAQSGKLVMDILAKTYRYNDNSDQEAQR